MPQTSSPPVVALVASAGGLDALTRVLQPLPSTFPAALIALQHSDPHHPSRLSPLLAARCTMPVTEAAEGARLSTGHVHVAPSGHHTLVSSHRRVALIPSGDFPPHRPSADLLLVSMAVTLGSAAIVAVLSGLGHDGATGASAIHHFGGTVVASDEASSREYAMPAASIARTGAVDHVRSLDVIPALLEELAAVPR